ncbi:MAG: cell division protein ZapA [Bacteroidales bacterium]|nr:cell division protein ZapA [Bacteroidales bacterium]
METQSVTVTILERSYKLQIAAAEERYLRTAASLIDAQARLFGKQYSYRDHQDLVAMVALSQITELVKMQENQQYKDNELIKKLTEIDSLLEQNLHPTQNSL